MWNSWYTIVFMKDMIIINRSPAYLTHSNPTRVQNFTRQRWKLLDWRLDDPCSSNVNITFKAWRYDVINISSRACHHIVQSLPRNPNVLYEDQNSSPSTYKNGRYANAIQHVWLSIGKNEDKFHIRSWWSKVHQLT